MTTLKWKNKDNNRIWGGWKNKVIKSCYKSGQIVNVDTKRVLEGGCLKGGCSWKDKNHYRTMLQSILNVRKEAYRETILSYG